METCVSLFLMLIIASLGMINFRQQDAKHASP